MSRGAHCPGWNNYQLLNRNYRRRAWFEAAAGGHGPGKRTDGDPAPRRRVRKFVHRKRQVLFYRHGGSFRMQKRGKFETGVKAGRNDAALKDDALKRAEPGRPGRLRLRSLAARGLAAVLLVAFAALLALPPQAQAQTSITQTAEGATWTLTGYTSVEAGSTYTFTITLTSGTKTTKRIRWIPPAQHLGQSGQAGTRSERLHLAETILHLLQRRTGFARRYLEQHTGTRHPL